MPQQQTQQKNQGNRMNNGGTNGAAKPVHVARYGSLKGAVWKNMVESGNATRAMYNVTFTRSYKEGEDWKDSTSFGLDDLLTIAKIANDCHSWIHAERSRDSSDQT